MLKILGITVIALSIALAGSAFAADGAAVYKAKCALCHGPEGQGTAIAPAHKGNEFIKKSADDQIAEVITKGRTGAAKKYKNFPTPMAPISLSADDMKAVIAHSRTLAGK